MINTIVENIENDKIFVSDIEYIWNLKNDSEKQVLYDFIKGKRRKKQVKLESNIYYPTFYKIEDNCPTCGYRTPISKQKYSEDFIVKNIEYRLKDLELYNIGGINCYNTGITGLRELYIILSYLKNYDLDINVSMSNYEKLEQLKYFNINSIIYVPEQNPLNKNNHREKEKYEEKVIEYIKDNLKFKVTYQLTLYYNETHLHIFEHILKFKRLGVNTLEIKGFNPFIDSPEEYHPQYSKDFILKMILLFKLYLPKVELKIQYASNKNNYIPDFIKLNVDSISGIYTPFMNDKLKNTKEISKYIKK